MSVNLPGNLFEDIRQPIAGDSFNWYAKEPTAAKKNLVFHHSGVNSARANEDGYSIANYHVSHNGWGGIGYHFVIRNDRHPKGAGIEYVGDLGTWRAHVENANNGKVGICLAGNFEEEVPGPNQLRLARQLVDFFIAPNNILPSINYYNQVTGHGLIAGQQTGCPGWRGPHFDEWFNHLKGGAFPDHLYQPTPPPTPEPVVIIPSIIFPEIEPSVPVAVPVVEVTTPATPEPGRGGGASPEWVYSLTNRNEQATVKREAYAVDVPASNNAGQLVKVGAPIAVGTIVNVAGEFTFQGSRYLRTSWATSHNVWNGIPAEFFEESNGYSDGPVIVTPVVPIPTVSDEDFQDAVVPEAPAKPKFSLSGWVRELMARLFASLAKKVAK